MKKQKPTSSAGRKPGQKKTKGSQEPAQGKKRARAAKLPSEDGKESGAVARAEPMGLVPEPQVAERLDPAVPAAAGSGPDPAPTKHGDTPGEVASARGVSPKGRERDPRLPPPGTVLQRKDRQGQVRCECVVLEEGVSYSGTVYRSLSGAAVAAAKASGARGDSANGFAYWGLTKPKRSAGRSPLLGLCRSWDGYQARLETALELGGETLPELLGTLERHARILRNRYEEARETSAPPAAATA